MAFAATNASAAAHPHEERMQALSMSFLVIVVSEIGDKTFLIAAVLAMRNPRLLVFSAAMSALLVMTVLSALLGQVLPSILSKQYTQILAALLFFVFGLRLLREGWLMSGNECMEELEEVTQELNEDSSEDNLDGEPLPKKDDDVEARLPLKNSSESLPRDKASFKTTGSSTSHPIVSVAEKFVMIARRVGRNVRSAASQVLSPVWVQAFVLTFLAEWGDRSQIATVALAGAEDFWWVTIGGLAGHALCSGIAVIGGRMLATKISVRAVTLLGAVLFIICGIIGFWEFYMENYSV